MTIEEMEKEISEVPKFSSGAGLDNLKRYLDELGHPENNLRVLHVAGTNGKGSVCAYLDAILRKAGFKTALFTSPHLIHINERFRINFQVCEDNKLIEAWNQIKALIRDETREERKPLTYFEILFLMSLIVFNKEDADYCIMETGLGGRLDATVMTKPVLSVITSISLDHTALLGDTIEAIAGEKAGIIKKGVPVVVLDENNGAFPVFRKKAERENSYIYKISSEKVRFLKKIENKIDFSIDSSYYKNNYFSICSEAEYQIYNAALAITAVKILLPQIQDETVQEGIGSMRWPGRMEEILPGVYVDGAHNPGAVRQICRSLLRRGGRWSLLFAVCADKDYTEMIQMLAEIPWLRIYVTTIEEVRGAKPSEVQKCFQQYSEVPLYEYKDAASALAAAWRQKDEEECILCLGSLYLAGELLADKTVREIKEQETYILESEDIS